MKQFRTHCFAILVCMPCFWAPAPAAAQVANTVTRIDTNPAGANFYVDGVAYNGATTAVWPIHSSHTLSVPLGNTDITQNGVLTQFNGWTWTGGGSSGLVTLVVTADPTITEYTANFAVSYSLTVDCSSASGSVYANGAALPCGQVVYYAANSVIPFTAVPAPGYLFAGWVPRANQVIQGPSDVVTFSAPTQITPMFQAGLQANVLTNPSGLRMLVDGADVLTPYQAEWGAGSVHNIYPESPQQDIVGNWWVCTPSTCAVSSYTVPNSSLPITLTSTFVPGVPMGFYTSPAGLGLTVDNRNNWTSYSFIWGVGETHTVSAAPQQTDSQGHVWAFSGWSNGGAATQSITVPASAVPAGIKFVATYTPMAHLIVTSAVAGLSVMVNGSACAMPCDQVFATGTQVDVSAPLSVPVGSGSRQDFLGWSNGAGPGDLVLTLGSDPVTVAANYHLMNYLAASSNPPGGVNWSMQPASPDGYYDSATSVNVSVTAQQGYKFRMWTGDLNGGVPSGTLAMSVPRSIQAILDKVPYIPPSAVTNGAGGTAGSGVAPGSVISIYGLNLASGTVVGPSSPLSQTLGGVTVKIGSRLLPLFFVSSTQLNAQLPADFTLGQQTVTVSAPGQPDVQASFTIVQDAPGLFSQPVNGQAMAVAFHADGSAITAGSPAQQGETVTLYGTGFGPTAPARPEGLPVAAALPLSDPAAVQLGGAGFAAQRAFAVPGAIGVDAIQFVLGTGAANGQLTVTVNGQPSNTVVLPMQ